MPSSNQIKRAVAGLVQRNKATPKAIISTIFGDMVVPHADMIWLSSIVTLASCFDITESHARTTTLRLRNENWLDCVRVGKLSYYGGVVERTLDYSKSVYAIPNESWTGDWLVLYTGSADIPKPAYVKLRQALVWEGVGRLAPHVFVSLSPDMQRMTRLLESFGLQDRVQFLRAQALPGKDPELVRRIVRDAWAIGDIEFRYEQFLKRFRPIKQILDKEPQGLDPESCFIIRILLILHYRIIALRDPHLPSTLLPKPWAGHAAFTLCKTLYEQVVEGSEAYLVDSVRALDGRFKPAGPILWDRFGGLSATPKDR